MCQATIGKVISVEGGMARVSYRKEVLELDAKLLPNLQEGEYVLFSSGIAIDRIDREEAEMLGAGE